MEMQSQNREYGSWLEGQQDALLPGLLVLDFGCGTGDDARYMMDAGLRVIGLDLSPQRVARAAARAPGALFIVGNLADGLPLRSSIADLAIASLSLHYFDRRTTAAIVQDIARVLRPGAVLLCRVNVAGEKQALWGVGVEHEPDFFEVEPGRFKRFFTEDSLEETLQRHLTVEAIWLEETRVQHEFDKRTLVARARRQA